MAGTAAAAHGVAAIQRAMAIGPAAGTTYLDAEHVVILMQENRSFDHAFGALRGVRGFNDPRAMRLPDGNPVWVQTNDAGESYIPFRLGLLDTKSTWMGSLPHSWTDQVDARNNGNHDRWLQAKASADAAYAKMPLTMGYYDRQDIPFYYELADAFTICDQHFCSVLAGTTPNRSYLWSGTVRKAPREDSLAHLFNSEMDYGAEVNWTTFPERLEEWGVSWKVYQNELYLDVGFEGEQGPWLSNFGDNPLEYFEQYRPRFSKSHRRALQAQVEAIERELASPPSDEPGDETERAKKIEALGHAQRELCRWNEANFSGLSPRDQALHCRAFCTNASDPFYHQLDEIRYTQAGQQRLVQVPKGDVFHQFRQDVRTGKLPTVSWLVAPERFSDHPGSAWYGAWYIAESLRILTEDPEVWRKTIFILTYDENDGYFDHVPPFVPPHPRRPETGLTSPSIDPGLDYVDGSAEAGRRRPHEVRDSPIGLGYRVPMIIASPWSRGGWVCSQVFDHTSPLQFLERVLSHRRGHECKERNISPWRRAVCGDLTSAFHDGASGVVARLAAIDRNEYVELIHRAQLEKLPEPGAPLTADALTALNDGQAIPEFPQQEPGQRPSCALPYELIVEGALAASGDIFNIRFESRTQLFGARALGAPFTVYSLPGTSAMKIRNYAVAPGESIEDGWAADDFDDDLYCFVVHGPNGFYRRFEGIFGVPQMAVRMSPVSKLADLASGPPPAVFTIANHDDVRTVEVLIKDLSYSSISTIRTIGPNSTAEFTAETKTSYGWYDIQFTVNPASACKFQFAGRLEYGSPSTSDPLIGRATH